MGVTFLIGGCGLDSENSTIPLLMTVLPWLWLIPFGYANGAFEEGDDDESYE